MSSSPHAGLSDQRRARLTDRMLADRLQELADAGLVDRIVLEGPPVGVRYQLTARGEDLRGVFAELEAWAERHLLDVVVGGGVAPRCVIRTVLAS